MRYKLCKFCENRAKDTPLRGVYIPHIGQIWVKISVFGVLHLCHCTDGGEIWHGEGEKVPSSVPNFTPIGATCCPSGAKNLKIGLWVNGHVELLHIVVNATTVTCIKGRLHSLYCRSLIDFMTWQISAFLTFLTQGFISSHFVSVCVN